MGNTKMGKHKMGNKNGKLSVKKLVMCSYSRLCSKTPRPAREIMWGGGKCAVIVVFGVIRVRVEWWKNRWARLYSMNNGI